MTLDQIESGTRVFIDATIFIYHFTGVSQDCRDLLERCEQGDLRGLTSIVALAEATHRLMMIEAVAKGLVSPGNVARKLRRQPETVRKLNLYHEQIEKIPLMAVEVTPLDLRSLLRAKKVRKQHGFLTNDSILATAAQEGGIHAIASADRDFERLAGIRLFQPSDLH